MIIKLKQVRNVWAYCQNNREHGYTPYELSIDFGFLSLTGYLKLWLCKDCLIDLLNQYELVLGKHKLLPRVKSSIPLILQQRTLPKLKKRKH